jgi:hypothetical protein
LLQGKEVCLFLCGVVGHKARGGRLVQECPHKWFGGADKPEIPGALIRVHHLG